MPLDIEIKASEEKVIIKFPVRFDMTVAENFRDAVRKFPKYVLNYELDMNNTEYMDAAALGSLMLLKYDKPEAINMDVTNCSKEILHLLMLMNYDALFNIQTDNSELHERDVAVHVA
ncbi:MAG: STAS domain-containing protein [Gammaproteobacteria bacterium]|nr:STAS domain-containing protein [Gammaproteobacteria bacterium]